MKLSVIIINYNTAEMTEKAIRNFLEKENELLGEIILIDNGSTEKLNEEKFRRLGAKLIMNKENLGFANAANQGIEAAAGEFILLLNSDVFIEKGAISKMIDYMEKNKGVGVMGPKFIYPDNRSQISAGRMPTFWREIVRLSLLYKIFSFNAPYVTDFKKSREVDWISGGCMLIKAELIKNIGLLDGNYFFGYEDMDFCLRAKRASWRVVYWPLAKVVHWHGFSSGGRRAAWRTERERDGLYYFFQKNFPRKRLARGIIKLIYEIKILVFKTLGL